MAKGTPQLEWCIVRLGEDHNWWVTEVSDSVRWDADGLSIIDPRQVARTANYVYTDNAVGAPVVVTLTSSNTDVLRSTAVTIPAVIVGHLYWPRLDAWLGRLVVIHYALPAVVLVVGYYRLYSGYPLPLNGTPYILFLAYVPIFFPLLYISMKNGLSALPTDEASRSLRSLTAAR